MGQRYSETLTIPFDMTDVRQEIVLSQFISYCLGVSGRQSENLGRSDLYLFEKYNLVWVVTDYDVTITRLPHYNEEVTITTEAISYNKFYCYRKFFVYDQEGNLLIEIFSSFVLIDFKTRKVATVSEEVIAPYEAEKIKKIIRGAKYTELENPIDQDYRIRYFDIDMNGHVNNGKYLEWMYDVLDYDFLVTHRPSRIQLKYVKEVSPGGTITSSYQMADNISRHAILSEGHIHAQAIIDWENRDVQ